MAAISAISLPGNTASTRSTASRCSAGKGPGGVRRGSSAAALSSATPSSEARRAAIRPSAKRGARAWRSGDRMSGHSARWRYRLGTGAEGSCNAASAVTSARTASGKPSIRGIGGTEATTGGGSRTAWSSRAARRRPGHRRSR